MSDYSYLMLAKQQMNERIEETRRSRMAGRPRRTRRHVVANGLRVLASHIDA